MIVRSIDSISQYLDKFTSNFIVVDKYICTTLLKFFFTLINIT